MGGDALECAGLTALFQTGSWKQRASIRAPRTRPRLGFAIPILQRITTRNDAVYADLPETGALVLRNCCQYGQACTAVLEGGMNREVCLGPLPGQAGSTCRPQAGSIGRCETTALCEEGDPARLGRRLAQKSLVALHFILY